jgi:hypothetical protein
MAAMHVIAHWNPEDKGFWERFGRGVATRNLWLSIGALTLAFAVWMLWSVVVVHLPAAGFHYSTNQLFWLAALPALCGATLRIFYAFAVPVVGGRRFNALATASLLLPALGIGLAVQDPGTPYEVMVVLALLCGLGGGNFASSMAHISFFYPEGQARLRAGHERRPRPPRRVDGAVRGAAGHRRRALRRARRRAASHGRGADVAAERRLRLGAVHRWPARWPAGSAWTISPTPGPASPSRR